MLLRDYLHINRLTASKFAKMLGIDGNYMRMIKNGRAKPGKDLAIEIELVTGGQVTVKELRGEN